MINPRLCPEDMGGGCSTVLIQAKNRVDKGFPTAAKGDSLDWKDLTAGEIQNRVLPKVQKGSIVLFHNAAKHTPEALPGIIEGLIAEGYSIVPVSQLLLSGEYTINHEGRQLPADRT